MPKFIVLACALLGVIPLRAQAEDAPRMHRIRAQDITSLRQWDQRVDSMLREGQLRIRQSVPDAEVSGRTFERAAQYYKGVPVFGAEVTRQLDRGQTVSVFGVVYSEIDLEVGPTIGAEQAAALLQGETGRRPDGVNAPVLVVLPTAGGYALAWRARVLSRREVTVYFVDAHSGRVIDSFSDLKTQSAVGKGVGVLGDQKKMSVEPATGAYLAVDHLRPPSIGTFDFRGDVNKVLDILEGRRPLLVSDAAADTDNDWTDGAAVDAHVYAGYTYDYFFKRHGRSGLNGRDITMTNFVHMVRRQDFETAPDDLIDFYLNAGYLGGGLMIYGEGLPPGYVLRPYLQTVDYFSGALDIVAHELTHGVTEYTSDLIYRNESGALNEAFSDVMAIGAEFMFQAPGGSLGQADYTLGEDVIRPGGIRSMSDPARFGQPDHYSRRFVGTQDNGGVHINSGIVNQAYYLAIESGTNRTSGQSVTGVGAANREQIEKVFYRAFTALLPAGADFSTARSATIQAARDLYGAGSAPERALAQAWSAVGVN